MDRPCSPKVAELIRRGLHSYGLGETDAAIASWQEALVLDPGNPTALDYLRTAREGSSIETNGALVRTEKPSGEPGGRVPEAQADGSGFLRRSVSFGPVGENDDTPRTISELEMARHAPDSDDEVQRALAAYRVGDLDLAHAILHQVHRREPGRLDVEGYLAIIRTKRAQRWVKAIGDRGRTLRATVSPTELSKLELALDEGALLAQLDGTLTIEQVLCLQPDRVRGLEIVARLLRDGVVE